jgi:hypothetical protein
MEASAAGRNQKKEGQMPLEARCYCKNPASSLAVTAAEPPGGIAPRHCHPERQRLPEGITLWLNICANIIDRHLLGKDCVHAMPPAAAQVAGVEDAGSKRTGQAPAIWHCSPMQKPATPLSKSLGGVDGVNGSPAGIGADQADQPAGRPRRHRAKQGRKAGVRSGSIATTRSRRPAALSPTTNPGGRARTGTMAPPGQTKQ